MMPAAKRPRESHQAVVSVYSSRRWGWGIVFRSFLPVFYSGFFLRFVVAVLRVTDRVTEAAVKSHPAT